MMTVIEPSRARSRNPLVQTFQLFREIFLSDVAKWTLGLMAVLTTVGPFIGGIRTALIPMYDHSIDYMFLPTEIALSIGTPILGYLIWRRIVGGTQYQVLPRLIMTMVAGAVLTVAGLVVSLHAALMVSLTFNIDYEIIMTEDPLFYIRFVAIAGIIAGSVAGYFLTRKRQGNSQPM